MSSLRQVPLLLLLAACATSQPPPPVAPQSTRPPMQEQIDELRSLIYVVATNSLCHPDVQTLVAQVVRTCEEKKDPVCVDAKIRFLVSQVDPGGRFITLMSSQPRAVLYPENGPDGSLVLPSQQQERLRQLAQPPWLPTTRFLVVTNIGKDGNTAIPKDRAKRMRDYLARRLDFPDFPGQRVREDRIFGWVFNFAIQRGELRPMERPTVRGVTPEQGVLIFRTDCRLPKDAAPQPAGQVPQ